MITVEKTIHAVIDKVWDFWTLPKHIQNWNNAIDDWYTPSAENDLKVDGRFKYKMAKKDGSLSFNFEGVYTKVEPFLLIEYKLDDDRIGRISFEKNENEVKITEIFEPTTGDSISMQQEWCDTVLENFKKYVESV